MCSSVWFCFELPFYSCFGARTYHVQHKTKNPEQCPDVCFVTTVEDGCELQNENLLWVPPPSTVVATALMLAPFPYHATIFKQRNDPTACAGEVSSRSTNALLWAVSSIRWIAMYAVRQRNDSVACVAPKTKKPPGGGSFADFRSSHTKLWHSASSIAHWPEKASTFALVWNYCAGTADCDCSWRIMSSPIARISG